VCTTFGAESLKTFISKEYHYSTSYPADWFEANGHSGDPLRLIDFPPSDAVRAVFIPRSGAEIVLGPVTAFHLRQIPETPDQWATMDARRTHVIGRRTFDLRDTSPGMSRIIEVRTEELEPTLEGVNWYFILEGRLFKAMLLYWQGNSKVEQLIDTLNQVVRTVKPRD
jgi:hypothetical protein